MTHYICDEDRNGRRDGRYPKNLHKSRKDFTKYATTGYMKGEAELAQQIGSSMLFVLHTYCCI